MIALNVLVVAVAWALLTSAAALGSYAWLQRRRSRYGAPPPPSVDRLEDARYTWLYARPRIDPSDESRRLEPLSPDAFHELTGLTIHEAQALLASPANGVHAQAIHDTLDVHSTGPNRWMAVIIHLCARVRRLERELDERTERR